VHAQLYQLQRQRYIRFPIPVDLDGELVLRPVVLLLLEAELGVVRLHLLGDGLGQETDQSSRQKGKGAWTQRGRYIKQKKMKTNRFKKERRIPMSNKAAAINKRKLCEWKTEKNTTWKETRHTSHTHGGKSQGRWTYSWVRAGWSLRRYMSIYAEVGADETAAAAVGLPPAGEGAKGGAPGGGGTKGGGTGGPTVREGATGATGARGGAGGAEGGAGGAAGGAAGPNEGAGGTPLLPLLP